MQILLLFILLFFLNSAAFASGVVDELPNDKFDIYPANEFPPFPWERVGERREDVTFLLKTENESPFMGNTATGKGFTSIDNSVVAGNGDGITNKFTPPPSGRFYMGFDFKLSRNEKGMAPGFSTILSDNSNKKLIFKMNEKNGLSIIISGKQEDFLGSLVVDKWYRLSFIQDEGNLSITLLNIDNTRRNRHSVKIKSHDKLLRVRKEADMLRYSSLSFLNSDKPDDVGQWAIDTVNLAGDVSANRLKMLPHNPISYTELLKSKKKVLAYYFIYGSGFTDKDPGLGWFNRVSLNPTHTKPERLKSGTELLLTPLPRPPMKEGLSVKEVRTRAKEEEVRLAISQGIDGFYADFHSFPNPQNGQAHFTENSFLLMDAALNVDPNFKILPSVYSSGGVSGVNSEADEARSPEEYANSPILKRIMKHPAAMRTSDNKVILSMWLSERHSPRWWQRVLELLEKAGTPAVLVSHFNSTHRLKEYSGISYAMAHWGPRTPKPYNWIDIARGLTDIVIFPVVSQDVRTRGSGLWESGNNDLIVNLWTQAIEKKSDWVFLNTWNDYTETPMAPSTFIGFAPYDLNTYFTQWYKTGIEPEIVRDVLFYSYRRNHSEAEPSIGEKWSGKGTTLTDNIELLAFLTSSGTLSIEVDGKIIEKDAPAGITSFKVPFPKGVSFTPKFKLSRKGVNVINRKGRYSIEADIEYSHMIYSQGSFSSEMNGKL